MDRPENEARPFHIAVAAMETRMAEFYRKLASWAEQAETRDTFLFLAAEEEDHAREFSELSDRPVRLEALNRAFREAGDVMGYLRLGLTDIPRFSRKHSSQEEALRLGIRAEKDSIAFYQALLPHVDDPDTALDVRKLLEAEEQHLEHLTTLLRIALDR